MNQIGARNLNPVINHYKHVCSDVISGKMREKSQQKRTLKWDLSIFKVWEWTIQINLKKIFYVIFINYFAFFALLIFFLFLSSPFLVSLVESRWIWWKNYQKKQDTSQNGLPLRKIIGSLCIYM